MELSALLQELDGEPEPDDAQVLLHTEIGPSHVLMDSAQVTGLFDFAEARAGLPEYDLAAVGLLLRAVIAPPFARCSMVTVCRNRDEGAPSCVGSCATRSCIGMATWPSISRRRLFPTPMTCGLPESTGLVTEALLASPLARTPQGALRPRLRFDQ